MKTFKNIAIIAHVDHGKTSLVDQLLTASGTMQHLEWHDLIMDSNDQERERGITIYAKNTSIQRHDTIINIVDTPGHADFGSEVERVLGMVDSVLLVVDAYEGPMPQTKFVLKKSLEKGLKPLVVINKIDKPTARPDWVINQLFDLFIQLGATDEQAEFPIIYTSARDWYALLDPTDLAAVQLTPSMEPLLDFIMEHVADAPHAIDKPFRMQVVNLSYDNFVGRLGIGRIAEGTIKMGTPVIVFKADGTKHSGKISKIYRTLGTSRVEVEQGDCGDIVMIAGMSDIFIGDTIALEWAIPYEPILIDPPTLAMDFLVNDSPFAGREGKFVTSRNIVDRLTKELETNVGLHVEIKEWGNRCTVSGRGELHLGVLIETMRREGFELQVSAPQVLMYKENGQTLEPVEEVIVNVDEALSGSVIQMLSDRKGMMQNMFTENGITTLEFHVPTRGMLGVRSQFILLTKGEGIMYSSFSHFAPSVGEIPKRVNGSMISMASGEAMRYSIWKLQDRGRIFVEPATKVYEGMIVGESAKPGDMTINLTKNKAQNNVRTGKADENMLLTPIHPPSLEEALGYIGQDEYVEITPLSIRLRKMHLNEWERKIAEKK